MTLNLSDLNFNFDVKTFKVDDKINNVLVQCGEPQSRVSQSGNNVVGVPLQIREGEYDGQTVWFNIMDTSQTQKLQAVKFFEAIGQDLSEQKPDFTAIKDAYLRINIVVKESEEFGIQPQANKFMATTANDVADLV